MLTPGQQIQTRHTCSTCNRTREVPTTADDGTVTATPCPDCQDGFRYQWISTHDLYKQFMDQLNFDTRQAVRRPGGFGGFPVQ